MRKFSSSPEGGLENLGDANREFRFCGSWSLDFRECGMGREHIERGTEEDLSLASKKAKEEGWMEAGSL